MKMKFAAVLIVCAALAAAPALAKNNKGNPHKGQSRTESVEGHDQGNGRGQGKGNDHDVLREYVVGHYKKNCPPGLAKKNPPCIPPGQAKKFAVGGTLPEDGWVFIPDDVASLLAPPPSGARYVRMDKDVYLMIEGTRKVLDAIELFSQVD